MYEQEHNAAQQQPDPATNRIDGPVRMDENPNLQEYINAQNKIPGAVINAYIVKDQRDRPRIAIYAEESCGYMSTYEIHQDQLITDYLTGLRIMCETLRAGMLGAPAQIAVRSNLTVYQTRYVKSTMKEIGAYTINDQFQPFIILPPGGTVWTLHNFIRRRRTDLGTRVKSDDSLIVYEMMHIAFESNYIVHPNEYPTFEYWEPIETRVHGKVRRGEFLAHTRNFNGFYILIDGEVVLVDNVQAISDT